MTRTQIFVIFTLIDLAIVGGCVWSVFHRIPVRQFLVPAIVLFTLSALWLLWMTLRHTPPGNKQLAAGNSKTKTMKPPKTNVRENR